MILNFSEYNNIGALVNPPASGVVLTDTDTYSYSADTYVASATYTRTFAKSNTYYGWCMPCDFPFTTDMAEHFLFFAIDDVRFSRDSGNMQVIPRRIYAGDILKANTPYLLTSLSANNTYTFNADNSKGYVLLHGTLNYKPILKFVNAGGQWVFYAVQNRTTRVDLGVDSFYYLTSSGQTSKATKDTTAVNSYRWIFTQNPL